MVSQSFPIFSEQCFLEVFLTTGGNTELQAVLLRASDLTDIFTLGLFVSEVIDFRTIIDRAEGRWTPGRFIESVKANFR